MASEDPRNLILEEGIFFLEDPEIGRRVHEFDENKFPFQTEDCLDLIEKNILNNTRIRETVKSCIERPGLGFLKALGPNPYRVFCFNSTAGSKECAEETSSKRGDSKLLVVQLLSPGSELVYYKASHQYPLKVKPASIGFLEVQKESLEKAHIERLEVTMKEGGLAIVDGKLGFGIIQGMGIMVGFTMEEVVKSWPKMMLLGAKSIKQKLMRMTDEGIYMNFGFVDLPSEGERDRA